MKRIFFFMLIAMLAVSYQAYSQAPFVGTTTNSSRAILNTSADTAKYTLSGVGSVTSIQTKVTKATGTMAGKIYVWSSPDGANYTLRDSATLTNVATQYSTFDYTGQVRQYWMVVQNGATTVTGTLNAKIWLAGH